MTALRRAGLAIMRHVGTDRHIIEIRHQRSHLLTGSMTFLGGVEKDIEDPLGLHDIDQVGRVARLTLRMGRRQDGREPGDTVETESPFILPGLLGDVLRPGFGVEDAEATQEGPEVEVIPLDGAGLRGRRA